MEIKKEGPVETLQHWTNCNRSPASLQNVDIQNISPEQWSQDSSVSKVISYGLGDRDSILSRDIGLFLLHHVLTGSKETDRQTDR
jgi:hypothetical protein